MLLIDSYARGRITTVPLDGGNVITGRNGRGKTSLLQITPLFHGESPSRLTIKSEGRQSFARHYLANSTSYIVFEYVRGPGEYRMAVIYAHKDDQLAWRFVRAPFSPELFLDDRDQIVEGRDLYYHLKPMGIEVSRQILSQAEYRNILHNTPDRKGDQKGLALDFSIMPRGKSMRGVERIVSGMFARQTSFTDLQNIIVADIRDGDDSVPLMADRTQAEEWVSDHAAYSEVMARHMDFEAAAAASQTMRVAHDAMRDGARRLQAYLEHDARRQQAIVRRRSETLAAERKIDDEDVVRLREMDRRIGKEKDEAEDLSARSAEHARVKADFERQGVDDLARRILDLPNAEQRLNLARHRRDALTGTNDEVTAKHRALLEQIDVTERLTAARIQKEQTDALATLDEERLREAEEMRSNAAHAASQAQTESIAAGGALSDVKIRRGELSSDLRSVRAPDEVETACDQAQLDLDACGVVVRRATTASADARIRKSEAKSRHNRSEQRLVHAEREVDERHAQLERTREFVQGRPGSLLRLLRQDRPDLVDPLSRLLTAEALLSNDLAAERVDDADSLYGFSIDHGRLEPHESADPQMAAERVEAASALHEQAKARRNEAEAENRTAANEYQVADRLESEAVYSLEAATAAEARQVEVRKAALALRDDARDRERQRIEQEISLVEQEIEVAERRLAAARDRMQAARREEAEEQRRHADAFSRRHKALLADFEKRAAQTRINAQTQRSEARAVLLRDLHHHGVDPDSIGQAERDVGKAELELEGLLAAQRIVEAHARWKNSEALPESRRQVRLRDLKAALPALERARSTLDRDIAERRQALAAERDALRREEDAMADPRGQASTRLAALSAILGGLPGDVGVWSAHDDLHAVIKDVNQAQNANDRARSNRSKHLQILDAAFSGHPGSQIQHFRHGGRFDAEAQGDPVRGYAAWYGHIHNDTKRAMAGIGRQIAQAIGTFHDQLKEFERSIQRFNRELQQHLGEATSFEGVADLEIRVVSTISELSYWKRIERVADLATTWRRSDGTEESHEATFVEALASLLEMWRLSGSLRAELQQHIRIEGNVTENGQRKVFRNAAHLVAISSNGLSYLILVSIFIAFLNRIRKGAPVTITWALDELRDIDRQNTRVLMNLLRRNNIELFTAFPDPDPDIMSMFRHRFMVGDNRTLMRVRASGDQANISADVDHAYGRHANGHGPLGQADKDALAFVSAPVMPQPSGIDGGGAHVP